MAFDLSAAVKISASVTGQQAVDQLKTSFKNLEGGVGTLSRGVGLLKGALGTLGIAFGIAQIVNFGKSVINLADNLRDMSQKTGIGVQTLSDLKTAGELNGVEFEKMQGSLRKFSINLSEATRGAGTAAGAFKALHLDPRQFKSSDEALFAIADKFKNIPDGAKKAELAFRLFGKSGVDLIPVLNGGAEAIRGFGATIDKDFSNRADQLNDTFTLMGVAIKNQAIAGLKELLPTIQDVANYFLDLAKTRSVSVAFFDVIGEAARLLVVTLEVVKISVDTLIDTILTKFRQGLTVIDGFGAALDSVVNAPSDSSAGKVFENATEAFLQTAQGVTKLQDEENKRLIERSEASARRIKDILKNSFSAGLLDGKSIEEIRKIQLASNKAKDQRPGLGDIDASGLDDKAAEKQQKAIEATEDRINKINAETAALGKNEEQKRIITELTDLENRGIKEGTQLYDVYSKKIIEAVKAQEKQKQALAADPWRGATKALEDYIKAANDMASQVGSVVSDSLKGLEDQFVGFFTTGKFQWREFANAIIAELVRVAVRRAIIAPIAGAITGAFGFADGGIMSSRGPMPLERYATGGIASSPQLALFGEGSRPEAFVPLPDGRNIPVKMEGAGGGGVVVNVSVNVESGEQSATSSQPGAAALGKVIANAVKAELINQKRPGGLIA